MPTPPPTARALFAFAALLAAGTALCAAGPARAQVDAAPDTRLRLEQQIDRRRADREARDRQEAEDSAAPSSMTIDGETYAVGDTVDDIGRALYIAVMRRQWGDAARFLAAYRKLEGHDPMLAEYALGALARQRGDHPAAEAHYRALLALKPDFLPGLLELARSLFEDHRDREARALFEATLAQARTGGEEAKGVIASVETFLAALKRRRGWQGGFAMGPGFSSNVNQSSASYTCLLAADDGTCLIDRRVPDAIRATGVSFEGSLDRRVPLGGHGGVRLRAIAYGDVYPEHHAYSQTTAIVRVGFDRQTARGSIAVSPSFEVGSLGSSILYHAWAVNAEWVRALSPRATVKLEGNHREFTYPLTGFEAQSGGLSDVYLTAWYTLPGGWTLFGGPDAVSKDTDDRVNAYRQWGGRAGVARSFGDAVSVQLSAALRRRDYRAYSTLLEAKRRDDEQVYTGVLRVPALRIAGLTPEAVIQHNRVRSNVDWLYSYHRTTASLRLSLNF